jgi:xanthosine utilization system XapX-like protein
VEITFRVPRIPAGAISNVVGLLGLVTIAVAVGFLLHNWAWSLLVGGIFAVGLAVVAQAAAEAPSKAVKARPRVVAEAAKAS